MSVSKSRTDHNAISDLTTVAMLKCSDGTPCPTGSEPLPYGSFRDEITEDLNYTTELKATLRNAGPRRRTSTALQSQKAARADCAITAPSLASEQAEELADCLEPSKPLAFRLALPRRRVSQVRREPIDEISLKSHAPMNVVAGQDTLNIDKRPRRRTIYIPPDDTIVSTIHPGLPSDGTMLTECLAQIDHQRLGDLSHKNGKGDEKCGVKRASLAAAPKRVPLKPTLKPLQERDDQSDPPAAGSGKENVPPGSSIDQKGTIRPDYPPRARRTSVFQSMSEHCSVPKDSHNYQMRRAGTEQHPVSNAKSTCESPQRSSYTKIAGQVLNRDCRASMMNKRNSLYYGTSWKAHTKLKIDRKQKAPLAQFTAAAIPQIDMNIKTHYHVLKDNIDKPEMFEDAWLSYQESAIQQLLNRLFQTAHAKLRVLDLDQQDFRGRLLNLYQDSDCAIIFKRLHASLLYGALNPPRGSIADTHRLQTDVGLRQRFLRIWLGSYDLEALVSAAEVVVGRNALLCFTTRETNRPKNQRDLRKEHTRNVRLFIESCLLRNEDAHQTSDLSNPVWCWRRTMLRCLMMVLLLDKAKETGLLHRNLFQPSSRIKSSREILAELSSLLSPFLGDAIRPLAHLHYQLHHIQYPLLEYEYGIENLATDLRDGIRLTHLVELLLYPPESREGSREDISAIMPTGEVLISSRDDNNLGPLSQHLKFPCVTLTQRVCNVQLALSALSGENGVQNMTKGIKADDIVNGHREKTVTLLWGLVGNWGMETMVDFDNVREEIRRLGRRATCTEDSEFETGNDSEVTRGIEKYRYLLKEWARSIAHKQGLQVLNLTTSFSDGSVFAAIVDEYQKYLPQAYASKRPHKGQLEAKLREIGCSDSFGTFLHNSAHK